MNLQIKAILDQYGTSQVARAMGLPISTVHSWKRKNCIPGAKGSPAYEFRVGLFTKAVNKIKRKAT